MKMRLELEKPFLKKSKKLLQKNPSLKTTFERLLNALSDNPFDPALHTHPLTGKLKGKYACSLTYELRVVFRVYDDIVHLLDIGSHDEVY
ncbi:MAG: type II toxin-antitoxin system mRNA interferase toxin, RelE/StbE family [Nitrospiraceae bacterium]|nr:MAG: type II toxin-antitoxin system mRNA interferase toxin, RelE/StbE family [Nitrospiraceae bacterium]